jgi:hypothetical protein
LTINALHQHTYIHTPHHAQWNNLFGGAGGLLGGFGKQSDRRGYANGYKNDPNNGLVEDFRLERYNEKPVDPYGCVCVCVHVCVCV